MSIWLAYVGFQWKKWTYKQYYDDANTTAKGFIKLGLEPRKTVAILGFNAPEWFISEMGAISAGQFQLLWFAWFCWQFNNFKEEFRPGFTPPMDLTPASTFSRTAEQIYLWVINTFCCSEQETFWKLIVITAGCRGWEAVRQDQSLQRWVTTPEGGRHVRR